MTEKRYYWLKLKEDYFSTPKIKKLRKIAGGDTYTIIYLKMQLLSVKNAGCLYYEGIEPTFEEELALKLDEDLDNVKLTLSYLTTQKLIEKKEGNEFAILETQNSIGSESRSAGRVRAFREKQNKRALPCNTDVTKCNTDIDIDIEKDKELELEIDKELELDKELDTEKDKELDKEKEYKKKKAQTLNRNIMVLGDSPEQEVFNYWNSNRITQHKELNEPTLKAIKKAIKEHGLEAVKTAIGRYGIVYHDKDYFWNYQWSLENFLTRKKGLTDFLDNGEKWTNYANWKAKTKKTTTIFDDLLKQEGEIL